MFDLIPHTSFLWFGVYRLYVYCLIQVLTEVLCALWYFPLVKLYTFSIISIMSQPLREIVVAFGSIATHAIVVGTYFCFVIITGAFNMYVIGKGVNGTSSLTSLLREWRIISLAATNMLLICILVGYLINYWLGDIVPHDGGKSSCCWVVS